MNLTLEGNAVHALLQSPQPGRPTLLCIHGGGLDHRVWLAPLQRLAVHGFGFIAPDLPGHGASGGAPLADVPSMARWVTRLIDVLRPDVPRPDVPHPMVADNATRPAAGSESLLLVGQSMGAMVALHAAGEDGRRVATGASPRIAGIALLATAFPLAVSAALLEATASDEPGAQVMVNTWSHAIPRPGEGEIPPAQAVAMAANLACMQSQRSGTLRTDLQACNDYADGLTSAAQLRSPALLLLGDKDRMTPPHNAQALAAALQAQAGTRIVTLPGTGHNMMGEAPDAVAAALMQWADQQV